MSLHRPHVWNTSHNTGFLRVPSPPLTRSGLLPLPWMCCSPKQLRQAALIQTKGRSAEVLTEKAAVCLSALERYIGSKKFMFGTK